MVILFLFSSFLSFSLINARYKLIWSDEFNVNGPPNPKYWSYDIGIGPDYWGWGNDQWQTYTSDSQNLRVEDGSLVIQALCKAAKCGVRDGTITSGRINTAHKFEFLYGKVEGRIKIPAGWSAWPAFWMKSGSVDWPNGGDIDIMESPVDYNVTGRNPHTTHFAANWCDRSIEAPRPCTFPTGWMIQASQLTVAESLADDYHVYGAEWNKTHIIGLFDEKRYFQLKIDPQTMTFDTRYYIIINLAMGGLLASEGHSPNFENTFPQTLYVDWIRVWQKQLE